MSAVLGLCSIGVLFHAIKEFSYSRIELSDARFNEEFVDRFELDKRKGKWGTTDRLVLHAKIETGRQSDLLPDDYYKIEEFLNRRSYYLDDQLNDHFKKITDGIKDDDLVSIHSIEAESRSGFDFGLGRRIVRLESKGKVYIDESEFRSVTLKGSIILLFCSLVPMFTAVAIIKQKPTKRRRQRAQAHVV